MLRVICPVFVRVRLFNSEPTICDIFHKIVFLTEADAALLAYQGT